jgi:hypothetical protein
MANLGLTGLDAINEGRSVGTGSVNISIGDVIVKISEGGGEDEAAYRIGRNVIDRIKRKGVRL